MFIHKLPKFFFIFLIITSCKNGSNDYTYCQDENGKIFDDKITLQKTGQYAFALDTATSMSSYSVSMYQPSDQERWFSAISTLEKSIDIYNYNTGTLYTKVPILHEGPNGIGPSNTWLSHTIINKDSILLCNGYTFKLFVMNWKGEVLKRLNILDSITTDYDVRPQGGTDKPLYVVKGKAYIMGDRKNSRITDHTKMKMVMEVDLQTGAIRKLLSRPLVYNSGSWGTNFLLQNEYGTYNPNSNKFVFSFSADPFIHETDFLVDSVTLHYAGSKEFGKISPMSPEMTREFSPNESALYDFTNPNYYSIVYDPFARLYYRSAFLPLPRELYKNLHERYNRNQTIIILDENFTKVGECMLPQYRYVFDNFFVTKEGLHILLKPGLHATEDSMIYETFKPITKTHG